MNNLVAVGILIALINNKRISSRDLAEKFEVSQKTISRYILSLINSGIPITCHQGKNGGIEISDDFVLNKNFLTEQEIARLLSLIKTCGIENIDALSKSASTKLLQSLNNVKTKPENNLIIDDIPWGAQENNFKKYKDLIGLCSQNNVINFNYTALNGNQTKRRVSPYAVVKKDGVWYLYGFCEKRNDFRLFKCSRISNLEKLDEKFERKNIDLLNKPWLKGGVFNSKITLRLQVNKSILSDAPEWLENVKILNSFEDEVIIEGEAINTLGLITKIISYNSKITVLSPKEIASNVCHACKTILLNYV
ncbi:MAG: YafY family transcriptional regulator [Clostridia bacterium]|nr:YafY family transcriptional regulator [Clostridia bacterium]